MVPRNNFFLIALLLLSVLCVSCSDDSGGTSPGGNNAVLSGLLVSSGTLNPAFNPAVFSYHLDVPNTVTTFSLFATPADGDASVSYLPDWTIPLSVGSNAVTARVVSADGVSSNDYTVTVTRGSTNANLASLAITTGTLVPEFAPEVTDYVINSYVSNSAAVLAVPEDSGASVHYTFTEGSNNMASNTLVIRVTSQSGTVTRDYNIRVYRMGEDYTSANIGTLKYVPAGWFRRDSTHLNESFVSALRMSSTEITRSQYSNVMGADPANPAFSTGTSDPVHAVNWYHAIAFCNKLSIAEGLTPVYTVSGVNFTNLAPASIPISDNAIWNAATANWSASGYRLPTEMEWMWAAMGAQMGANPFSVNNTGYSKAFAGSTGINSINEYAWYGDNSDNKTHPAGSKLPNELGIYDMSGNVREWCWDWYADAYPDGYLGDYRGAASGTQRVSRGGGYSHNADNLAVSYRKGNSPFTDITYLGFRVVRQ